MIRLLETLSAAHKLELVSFCAQGLLGVKAIGPLLSYGTQYNFVQCWEQRNSGGKLLSFLSSSYGDLVVYSSADLPEEALEELREFISVISWNTLTAVPELTGEAPTGCQMKLERGRDCTAVPTADPVTVVENDQFRAFYDLLAVNNPGYFPADYPDWLVDFSHRVRHKTAYSILLEHNGHPVSTAAALSVTEPAVFLGAISTNPDCRGRHYAHTCVKYLSDRYADRTVYLMCMPEKQAFYEKAGMKKVGEFSVNRRDEFADIHIDTERQERTGFPEVVFCQSKTSEQCAEIFSGIYQANGLVLGTRASQEQYDAVKQVLPEALFHERARCITAGFPKTQVGDIAICSAGTTDVPVAEEAAITAEMCGSHVSRYYDVGVSGLHRLLDRIDDIRKANVVIAVAGMEGALASVVGGLIDAPLIALPTSIGYGANFGGLSALLAMLNSCAAGTTVVNIDNGFGAGYAASKINLLGERK